MSKSRYIRTLTSILGATLMATLTACTSTSSSPGGNFTPGPPPVSGGSTSLPINALQRIPHDKTRFTQGLEFIGPDTMVESTGLVGQSKVIIYQVSTQRVIKETALPAEQFGEGITQVDGKLVNLTWKSQKANVWALPDLSADKPFDYQGEGWGICYDQQAGVLWASDGSSSLTARDPKTFAITKKVDVTLAGKPIQKINELECVDGKIWANVWQTNRVIVINPSTGIVGSTVDLTQITALAQKDNGATFGPDQVLNGIAYHAPSDTWFVTGKQWPYLYQIVIGPKAVAATNPAPSSAKTPRSTP